ncbi:MAG: Lipoprotein LpqB, beta-propeller domain-like protein [Frankiales bacterium]|nr:Lipoprotein LpqB, beta-propeller domain-like protein [Frankiales bacterium]
MRRGLLALLVALLLTACGLPLPGGVQTPGRVPEGNAKDDEVEVLPPGPAEKASAVEIVTTFLGAQRSPEDAHAVARMFLTPEAAARWDDRAGVKVYDPSRLVVTQPAPETVRVVSQLTAEVDARGVYRRSARQDTEDYRVSCTAGRCRIAALPRGLRLDSATLGRSFSPRSVHFLAPPLAGAASGAAPHLVADLRWLPRTSPAQALVQAVLDGPSRVLDGSARTAVPGGTHLLQDVQTAADGTVTVDLSPEVLALDPAAREDLSAQLVWTLRALQTGFTRLRLLAAGRPLVVDGSAAPQDADAWPAYDPERLPSRVPALYVADRALRSLVDGGLATSDATEGRLPVDVAASSPSGFLGLLTRRDDGGADLRTGPQAGPFGRPRLSGDVSSPSWGSGDQGLFVLRAGRVVLLPPEGAAVPVPVVSDGRPLRAVRVSRDGVKVALLVGDADRPHLVVGRLVQGARGPRITDLEEVVPTLTGVVDVAWETGTGLVVLETSPQGVLPARVPVDGATVTVLGSRLPQGVTPVGLTAAAGRPVVLAARRDADPGGPLTLYREQDAEFVKQAPGSEPFYPG